MTEVIYICFSFDRGGAAFAAKKYKDVLCSGSRPLRIACINQDKSGFVQFLKRLVSFFAQKMQYDRNPVKHSLNFFSYSPALFSVINSRSSVHHIHWINNDTLSIFDFDKIPPGSIITLHDEWLYCGAEHCADLRAENQFFISGYRPFQRGVYGIHWNFLIWWVKKKKLSGRSDLIITAPSRWILGRARSSAILRNADIRYLPNPIDTQVFKRASTKHIAEYFHHIISFV